jgi:chromosome segregation ATPase
VSEKSIPPSLRSMSESEDLRAVLARLDQMSSDASAHKAASERRSEELSAKVDAIGAAQRSSASQVQELRGDVHRALEQSKRAIDTSLEAKRVATEIAADTRAVHDSIMAHNEGVGSRLTKQDKQLEALRFETQTQTRTLADQTTSLTALTKAEESRKTRETILAEHLKTEADKVDRAIKNSAPIFGMVAGIIGALVWLLVHLIK